MYLKDGTLLQNGRYRIERFIAAGGFGCTYQAVHVELGMRVAIKEFFPTTLCRRDAETGTVEVAVDSQHPLMEKLMSRFAREARHVNSLHHRGIVRVIDVFAENGTRYMVMEYIDGSTLQDIVTAHGPLPEGRAQRYLRQVAQALAYVHGHNLLHLDIKPGNIMIDGEDRAVLIDFGVSKQYDDGAGENLSTIIGTTPGYAPPEQMSNDTRYFSRATDIYALGATFYKVVTGNIPPNANARATGCEVLRPLSTRFSVGLRRAIESALAVRVSDRPQTIGQFLGILDASAPIPADNATVINLPAVPAPQQVAPEGELTVIIPAAKSPEPVRQQTPAAPVEKVEEPLIAPTPDFTYEEDDEEPEHRSRATIIKVAVIGIVLVGALVAALFIFSGGPGIQVKAPGAVQKVDEPEFEDLRFVNSKGVTFQYTGDLNANGEPHGKGEGEYPDGKYTGNYKNGLRYGQGTFLENTGNRFVGRFVDDAYSEGVLYMPDGSRYDGTFKDNKFKKGKYYPVTE